MPPTLSADSTSLAGRVAPDFEEMAAWIVPAGISTVPAQDGVGSAGSIGDDLVLPRPSGCVVVAGPSGGRRVYRRCRRRWCRHRCSPASGCRVAGVLGAVVGVGHRGGGVPVGGGRSGAAMESDARDVAVQVDPVALAGGMEVEGVPVKVLSKVFPAIVTLVASDE